MQLKIANGLFEEMTGHLKGGHGEQLAFLRVLAADDDTLKLGELRLIRASEFHYQSDWHIHLSDEIRAEIIKWAWDGGGGMGEAHSHRSRHPAQFSPSDLMGLQEFVPHVRWRLQGAPYVALVFGTGSFDSLVWTSTEPPEPADIALSSGRVIKPTGLTKTELDRGRSFQP